MKNEDINRQKHQQTKEDLSVIQEFNQGLEVLDNFPVYTPSLQWFEQMVLEEQQKVKRKLMKDLSIFMIVAVLILSGIILSLYHMPFLFMSLQIVTTIFIAVYSGVRVVKKVNNG